MRDLHFDLYGFTLENQAEGREHKHAQTIMRELGITYGHAFAQTIADSWWFLDCENVPDNLPSYITELRLDPDVRKRYTQKDPL